MEKGRHFDVKMKGWMPNGGHSYLHFKWADGLGRALCQIERVDAKRGHYDVKIKVDGPRENYHFQIKRADG